MTAVVAEFPEILSFLFEPAPYKVMYGGRAGMKSWAAARAALLIGAHPSILFKDRERVRVLCAREIQKSIADSVHHLLKEQIDFLHLNNFYTVRDTYISGLNGTEFIFAGLKTDPRKVKSMEGIDICIVEEAEKVSTPSWQTLVPTIRKSGSEIWVILNPDEESDPTYQDFVIHPPTGAVVKKVGWEDNPWLSERTKADKDHMYAVNPEAADNIWGGNPRRRSAAHIFASKYRVDDLGEVQKDWQGPYQGLDFGFSADPNAFTRSWVINNLNWNGHSYKKVLYIQHAKFGYHTELDDLPVLLNTVPDAARYETRADNARPETIRHLNTHGFPRVISCEKGKGSVEDGIQHLLNYDAIFIHPSNREMIEEAKFYSYKVDTASGIILPDIIDAFNHGWDSVRYGVEPLMKRTAMKINKDFLARIGAR